MALKIFYNALLKSYYTLVTLNNATCCLQLTQQLGTYISQPNPWSRDLVTKLIFSWLVIIFPVFRGTEV
jgi:hypothetical protein